MHILPEILTLTQHLNCLKKRDSFTPNCPRCDIKMWRYGYYFRKADRTGTLNPIPIQRFFCKQCRKTTSALPECIAPHRWYLWDFQQAVFLQILLGKSLRLISKLKKVGRATCRRWWNRFKEKYLLHGSILRVHDPTLGHHQDFKQFWVACLEKISLSKAMLLCHLSEVVIP